MATFKTTYNKIKKGEETLELVDKKLFDSFNEGILGLGEIDKKSKQMNAICAIFDLEGFTNFCKQIDPQLAVPEYLAEFLKWIFQEIKKETIEKVHNEGYETYTDLPFLSKYLGDGLLFLWDTEDMADDSIRNVVISMYEICEHYRNIFLPKISKMISSPPLKLRCGIARGAVYSVGNGNDYVGPCINMAARLQKLNSLTLSFARKGINPNDMVTYYKNSFLTKRVEIRGIGEELICVVKKEFDALEPIEKERFKPV